MKLFLSENLNYDENKTRLLCEFVLFCAEMLPIENHFEIHVVGLRKPYGITTTALYEVNNNCCKIYGKNRALVDVMRSIAHEMTHMMQDEMGLLIGHIQDAGGFHEDQANSKAGELIKLFVKNKEDRKSIYENKKLKPVIQSYHNFKLINEKIDAPRLNSDSGKIFNLNKEDVENNFDIDPNNLTNFTSKSGDKRTGVGKTEIDDGSGNKVTVYHGANYRMSDSSENAQKFAAKLFKKAKENPEKYDVPFITSGFRSAGDQARIMFNNWSVYVGIKTVNDNPSEKDFQNGLNYLTGLYKAKKTVEKLHNNFFKPKWKVFLKDGVKINNDLINHLTTNKVSNHQNGGALDFAMTKGIKDLLDQFKNEITIVDESTKKSGPHYHVSVK